MAEHDNPVPRTAGWMQGLPRVEEQTIALFVYCWNAR
jgi:hypothetical protein